MSARSKERILSLSLTWDCFVLAAIALAAAFASIMHLYPIRREVFPSYDSTAYIFMADGILKGRIPYSQLWENKGLPLYAIDMLGRVLTPGRYTGIWWLELASTFLVFWCVIGTLRRFASKRATALASGLLVLGILTTAVGGNTPEFWNLPLQASGLVAAWALVSDEWRSKRWVFALTGLAAGVAGMMKINLLGTWIALFGLLVGLMVARRIRARDATKLLGLMAAGFAVAVTISVVPIVAWGATRAWWDQWIVFGFNLTKSGVAGVRGSRIEAVGVGLDRALFISATLAAGLVAAPIGWIARGRPRPDAKRLWMGGFLIGWLALELWTSSISGLPYPHYTMVWLIPSVALIGMLFGGRTMRWQGLAFAVAVVALSLWYCAPGFNTRLVAHKGFPPVIRRESPGRHEAQVRMIREVKQRTRPSETVLVWGMDPIVFAETGRLSAGPYAHPTDVLLTPGYQSPERFAAFMHDLETQPPRLIIDSARLAQNRPSITELRVSTPTTATIGRIQPYMRALPDFVAARYRHVGNDGRVEYYELIGD